MKRMLGPLVVVAGLMLVVYLILTYVPIKPLLPDLPTQGNSAQVTVARINAETATYVVNAEYPQFGIPAIDTQIQRAVEEAVAEFESYPANPPDSATPQNEFTGTFDKIYVGSDIVSFELILSQYTGGAHPMTLLSGMNFDRATGRLLLPDDAFKLVGKTVRQVSEEATAQFEQKFGDAFFADGANSNPENFSSFTIAADEVTFIFQAYQVAAYAAGPQTISFARVH